MFDAIIFDLDGTLCDTLPDIHASVSRMLERLGYPPRTMTNTIGGMNHGSRNLIRHALPDGAGEDEIDTALAVYTEMYGAHVCDATTPYMGIQSLVERLSRDGVMLAVLSNKPDALVAKIVSTLFPGLFAMTVGQGPYELKPSAEAPLTIASVFGVPPEAVLIVGDSDVDVMTAHNAGMKSAGVTWGYRSREVIVNAGADFIVDTAQELYEKIRA